MEVVAAVVAVVAAVAAVVEDSEVVEGEVAAAVVSEAEGAAAVGEDSGDEVAVAAVEVRIEDFLCNLVYILSLAAIN